MSYNAQTDEILALLRTTIGDSTTIGTDPNTVTVTWQAKPEAPVLRYLDKGTDFPAVVLDPGETEQDAGPGVNVLRLTLPITISLVIDRATLIDNTAEATIHRCLREFGETVVGTLMDAGPNLGSDTLDEFHVLGYGRDDETPEMLERSDFGVYAIRTESVYHLLRPR